MRRRRFDKPPPDPEYDAEWQQYLAKAKANMATFDRLPPKVRHALAEAPVGNLELGSITRALAKWPEEIIAQQVTMSARQAYAMMQADEPRKKAPRKGPK